MAVTTFYFRLPDVQRDCPNPLPKHSTKWGNSLRTTVAIAAMTSTTKTSSMTTAAVTAIAGMEEEEEAAFPQAFASNMASLAVLVTTYGLMTELSGPPMTNSMLMDLVPVLVVVGY